MTGFTTASHRPLRVDVLLPKGRWRVWSCLLFANTACRVIGWYIGLGAFLALCAATAHASDEQGVFQRTYADLMPRYSVPQERFALGHIQRFATSELKPIILAEADVQAIPTPRQSAATIGVIYPNLGEPYHSIFAQIIDGIEDKAQLAVHDYPVGDNTVPSELDAQLKHDNVGIVIALGRQGLKVASTLNRGIPIVVGGVLAVPDMEKRDLLSISLTPDPALLFARLKSLLPNVKRVIVVYNPRYNDWLIKLARIAAKARGLELVAYEANDMANAARLYEAAFAASDGHRDAIWLPQDATTVDESTILPLVLRESWNRSVPVFSSSFLHVKKGALFALYPNNLELGKTLASTAQGVLHGELHRRGLLPLRAVQTAVNLRTASHIGLTIDYQQQRNFDFIFPEP